MRILVLGSSHVSALERARLPAERERLEIVNLWGPRKNGRRVEAMPALDAWDDRRPDVVGLSMASNLASVFTLMAAPEPFSIGDAALGAVPPLAPGRAFVPRDLMRELFAQRAEHMARHEDAVHRHFPDARFVHLCPPPPVAALRPGWGGTGLNDAAIDEHFRLRFALVPAPLRLALWALERELHEERAARHGAAFLPPPAAALADGFLADGFWDHDPTHGNARYGRLVLDALAALAREPA